MKGLAVEYRQLHTDIADKSNLLYGIGGEMKIQDARMLLLSNRGTNGELCRSIMRVEELSLRDAIYVVCLMTYYLTSGLDVRFECLEIFNKYEALVKEDRVKEFENNVDDEYPMDMALADDLQESMKEYLGGNATEEDLEVTVDRLMDHYFKPILDENDESNG